MGKYDDIINLERPISRKHKPMTMENRAAQFMPFAALTGYDDAVMETARYTGEKRELTQEKKAELDEKLAALSAGGDSFSAVITYFLPDRLKDGGEYVTREVTVRKIDTMGKCLILEDKTVIDIEDILSIGEL